MSVLVFPPNSPCYKPNEGFQWLGGKIAEHNRKHFSSALISVFNPKVVLVSGLASYRDSFCISETLAVEEMDSCSPVCQAHTTYPPLNTHTFAHLAHVQAHTLQA